MNRLYVVALCLSVVTLLGLVLSFSVFPTHEQTDPDPKISQAKSSHVLVVSLENDFDFDSLSSLEKRRNLLYAKEISVNETELFQFPSLLAAIKDIGQYDSFPNKGYSEIDESERNSLTRFMINKSEEQTGVAGSSYRAIELNDNIYHISYNSDYYPSEHLSLYVYPMEVSDTTEIFVDITREDFDFIPLVGEVLIKDQTIDTITNTPIKISVEDQKLYQNYLDSKFEEKYGKDTAPFGINHILFVDNSSSSRFIVQFENTPE